MANTRLSTPLRSIATHLRPHLAKLRDRQWWPERLGGTAASAQLANAAAFYDGDLQAAQPSTPTRFASTLARTATDEHLIVELENVTRYALPRLPTRLRRKYSRNELLGLLEEARLRIQVLETELELERAGHAEVPMLTDEWPLDDAPEDEWLTDRLEDIDRPLNDTGGTDATDPDGDGSVEQRA